MSVAALGVILGSLAVPFAVPGGLNPGSGVPEAGASSAPGVLLFYVVLTISGVSAVVLVAFFTLAALLESAFAPKP